MTTATVHRVLFTLCYGLSYERLLRARVRMRVRANYWLQPSKFLVLLHWARAQEQGDRMQALIDTSEVALLRVLWTLFFVSILTIKPIFPISPTGPLVSNPRHPEEHWNPDKNAVLRDPYFLIWHTIRITHTHMEIFHVYSSERIDFSDLCTG